MSYIVEKASREECERGIGQGRASIDACERTLVESRLSVGRYLAELRLQTRRNWKGKLAALGIDARASRRYVRLGNTELARLGSGAPDLIAGLPTDLVTLELLSRLPVGQIRGLLARRDLKEASRNVVTAEVKELLGGPKRPTRAAPSLEKEIQGVFKRLNVVFGRLGAEGQHPEDVLRLLEFVVDGLRKAHQAVDGVVSQLQAALAAHRTAPVAQP
jgi:hypothetical protein